MTRSNYKRAVGLSYQPQDEDAPAIAVQGSELFADEIVRIARRYGVAVVEDQGLADSLSELDLDQQIPPSLFKPVAIILARLKQLRIGQKS